MAPRLVAGVDQLEEQVAGAGADGEVADLVDDQQLRRGRDSGCARAGGLRGRPWRGCR